MCYDLARGPGVTAAQAGLAIQARQASMRSDPHCRKLLITTYSEDLMAILFSRLIAFVKCCVAVPSNRIGSKTMTLEQGIRYLCTGRRASRAAGLPYCGRPACLRGRHGRPNPPSPGCSRHRPGIRPCPSRCLDFLHLVSPFWFSCFASTFSNNLSSVFASSGASGGFARIQ